MTRPNVLYVKDGDEINFVAKLEPNVRDPDLSVPAVAQTFRVVANSLGPTFKLVSLMDKPVIIFTLPVS